MEYTVKKLADLSGISVRTLHYYDEIGLLSPSSRTEGGYRLYGEEALGRLQHILFFRELEFPLEDIQKMLSSPHFNSRQAMKDHRELLSRKKQRLENLLAALDTTLSSMKGDSMSSNTFSQAFSTENVDQYKEEVQQRWGHTDHYKQSQERTKHLKKEDWERIRLEADTIMKEVCRLMPEGVASPNVQAQMKALHTYMHHFYDCTPEFMAGLGEMYVADERFASSFEKYHPNLAVFVRDALRIYADNA